MLLRALMTADAFVLGLRPMRSFLVCNKKVPKETIFTDGPCKIMLVKISKIDSSKVLAVSWEMAIFWQKASLIFERVSVCTCFLFFIVFVFFVLIYCIWQKEIFRDLSRFL